MATTGIAYRNGPRPTTTRACTLGELEVLAAIHTHWLTCGEAPNLAAAARLTGVTHNTFSGRVRTLQGRGLLRALRLTREGTAELVAAGAALGIEEADHV